jgi:hypothetical protein
MNSFQTGPMPGFTISRNLGDPLRVEFNPPLGSDALFYALSQSYPGIKTHQLRIQKAVLEFHLTEFDQGSRLCDILPPLPTSTLKSPWQATSHVPSLPQDQSGPRPDRESQTGNSLLQFHSMLGDFTQTPGSRKAHTKRPMSRKDKEEYKIIKNIGACEKHRQKKKKVNF